MCMRIIVPHSLPKDPADSVPRPDRMEVVQIRQVSFGLHRYEMARYKRKATLHAVPTMSSSDRALFSA